jgi:hypothetical protein
MTTASELPHIADIVGPLLASVARDERPLLIAIAERMAADRYRAWARASADEGRRVALLACAEREEEIASRVEALYPEAGGTQADLLVKHLDLEELNRSLFADRPLEDQYTIQAQGERVGASTWRAFAEHAEAPAREVFLACAELEEQSAEVLESIQRGSACEPEAR